MTLNLKQLQADIEAGTKGPWAVRESRDFSGDIAITAADGIIAECFAAIRAFNEKSSETPANARRIANLPELEAALIEAVGVLRRCLNYIENTEGELGIALDSGDSARTLLAKLGADK